MFVVKKTYHVYTQRTIILLSSIRRLPALDLLQYLSAFKSIAVFLDQNIQYETKNKAIEF